MRDRHPHVRRPELRQHRAIDIIDRRMDDRLRMQHDLDSLGGDREQPRGLDQFQPLVHHRRGVDRDLSAHRPVRMRHRLLRRDAAHVLCRPFPERPTAGGQHDPADPLGPCEVEALINGVMLAVGREQRRARLGRGSLWDGPPLFPGIGYDAGA